jgi:hypothetical protein
MAKSRLCFRFFVFPCSPRTVADFAVGAEKTVRLNVVALLISGNRFRFGRHTMPGSFPVTEFTAN